MNPEAAVGAPDSSIVSSKRIQDEPRMNPKEMVFYTKAMLYCGAVIEIMQRQLGVPWEVIITPKPGTQVSDFARITATDIRINAEQNSALGIYQLLDLLVRPIERRKKFLGIF
jgi:hypothetical protein